MEPVRYSHFPPIGGDRSSHFRTEDSDPNHRLNQKGTVLIEAPLDPESVYRETLQSFQAQFRGAAFKHKPWESSKLEHFQTKRQRNMPTWRKDPLARSLSKQESNRGLKYRYKTFRYKGPLPNNQNEQSKDSTRQNAVHLPHLYNNALITRSMELSALSSSDTSTSFRWNPNQSRRERSDRTTDKSDSEFDDIYNDDDITMTVSNVFKESSRHINSDAYSKYRSRKESSDHEDDKILKMYRLPVNDKMTQKKNNLTFRAIPIDYKKKIQSETSPYLDNDPFGLLEACRNARTRERGLHVRESKRNENSSFRRGDNEVMVDEVSTHLDDVDSIDHAEDQIDINYVDDDEEGNSDDAIEEVTSPTSPVSRTKIERLPDVDVKGNAFSKKIDYKSLIGDKPLIQPDCYDQFARDTLPRLPDAIKDIDSGFNSRLRKKVRF